ncbi:putative RNA polymerase ECF-type sigma factor [Nocardia brasiliensis NBRC 14402]|uniref:RNA polymerase sigma factor n=1 Tax=Nocardia brasiliensis TaxID=37326 RepID=UPI000308D75F|nr:sigma-70 family RNA polymerase sigma factor [Nocardia brasiliensis]ASF09402.1 RNA polymerase subunit sigma-24 [Nocardia brasiliensis]GAJ86671.1 putative RNA polymerase ECF-type sigma factor [Nocardia brasiliensis NBRC 14402]SUB39901.1 Sigma-24 [Nocardia brasiliensis]
MSESASWPGDQLVLAAQHGDETAITALVSGAYPHIRRFATSLCASSQDAEDAAQEAVIVLFRKIGTLRATTALASWVFRIVRNECLRRAQLFTRRTAAAAEELSPSAEDDVLNRLEIERVAAAVALLPEDQRRVLIMRDIQGLPGKTVAASLGLSAAAMKSRLHRARAAVRAHLSVIEGSESR